MKHLQNALRELNKLKPGHVVEVELSNSPYDNIASIKYSLFFVSEDTEDGRVMNELFVTHNNLGSMKDFILGAAYGVDSQKEIE